MLFNSIQFLVFFQMFIGVYFLTPQRFKWQLLLAASIFFYMCWKPYYIIFLFFTIGIDFIAAVLIGKTDNRLYKKIFLAASLAGNIGLLFYFKYFNFFIQTINGVADTTFSIWDIVLPVGISFYTFQSMSYTIDVYRGDAKPQTNFAKFVLFVTFFPQLVAGPIERSNHLMPQLFKNPTFDYKRITVGYMYIIWGLFLKMVLADRAGEYVNEVYAETMSFNGLQVLTSVFLFCFQIYGDFMGYSIIALGTAKIMDIDLMKNFQQPHLSKSITEFWRRWHISLSTWFKDYVFIPLGGSRVSFSRRILNIILTFTLSGIWHGAKLPMVLWGFYHGVLVSIETSWDEFRERRGLAKTRLLHPVFSIAITFTLVAIGLILFRSNNLEQVGLIATKIADLNNYSFKGLNLFRHSFDALILASSILFLWITDINEKRTGNFWLLNCSIAARIVLCFTLIVLIILFGKFEAVDFIYFQF